LDKEEREERPPVNQKRAASVLIYPKSKIQRFEHANRDSEISHVVRTTVRMRDKIARLGIVSTSLSPWLFIPSSMTSCSTEWCLLSQVPTPEQVLLCSQVARKVETSIAFEPHKEAWLDQLRSVPVEVMIVDGEVRLPGTNHWFWGKDSGVLCVISRQPLRRGVPQGWTCVRRAFNHVKAGGVTDWKGTCFVFRAGSTSVTNFWNEECFQSVPGQFNDLVLDPMAGGTICGPPDADDYDSCHGSFPLQPWKESSAKFNRRKRFKFPNRTSPTRYVRRVLTSEEGLKLMDLPEALTNHLSMESKRLLAVAIETPLKVASSIGACLGAWIEDHTGTGGGGIFAHTWR
jgi:hypothetical protein